MDAISTPRSLLNRFCWSSFIVCSCAGTSFSVALNRQYSALGMIAAIAGFITCYVLIWSSPGFQRFLSIRGMTGTLKVGYALRMLFVLAFPISYFFDLQIGAMSIDVSRKLQIQRPFFTVVTTVVDGLIQHLLLALVMLAIYPFARLNNAVGVTPRGFEVLPVAPRTEPGTTGQPSCSNR